MISSSDKDLIGGNKNNKKSLGGEPDETKGEQDLSSFQSTSTKTCEIRLLY